MLLIIGAGLTGLSAAYHSSMDYMILEKEQWVGGLCRSINTRGYTFDIAPHIFFTKSEYVESLVRGLVGNNLLRKTRRAYICLDGHYIEYPFEVNLHSLPRHIIDECIEGARNRKNVNPMNFRDWIKVTFGDGVANHYMIPYNEKVWKYDLSMMNVDWVADRVPAPSVQEMVEGAEGRIKKDYGPNAQFSYPLIGGIGAIPIALAENVKNLGLESWVRQLKPTPKGVDAIYDNKGNSKRLDAGVVISSIPLPKLVKIIEGVPEEVIKASERLVYNSLVCVNIGVDRPNVSDKHWLYFPEKRFIFNRISFQSNFSTEVTPKAKSSIIVEATFRGEKPDLSEIKEAARHGLVEAGILRDDDHLDVFDAKIYKFAYVIYDLEHRRNVSIIHSYLRENRIIPAGRFGEWEYLNMDKSILSGKAAAEEATQ